MRSDIRLLVVGDEQVGKTSVITSLVTESYSEDVPHVLPEISIPAAVSPDNVSTTIVDSSARSEDRTELERQIRLAQVICLVYSVIDEGSFSRISSHWLPYIRSLGVSVPVVLVGNMIDLRGSTEEEYLVNENFEEQILPIMNDFKEVETCVECSALSLINIPEVFFFAQKSVLHPTAPLYDSKEQALKAKCQRALSRIFALSDLNKDNLLDDSELNSFQTKCFGQPLQQAELDGIKDLVRESLPNGVQLMGADSEREGHVREALTEAGFLFLHRLFIQRGRLETTWTVLRSFGYDDDLELSESFLHPEMPAMANDVRVELGAVGYQFLTELFGKFDRDKDGALNGNELAALFSTSCAQPANPWLEWGFPESTIVDSNGSVTLQGFLAQWAMMTLLDHVKTLENLAYLGFSAEDARLALRTLRSRNAKERIERDVFLCLVMGAVGSGKTSLLRSHVRCAFSTSHVPTLKSRFAVNSVEMSGMEKYLVLEEASALQGYDLSILADHDRMNSYDAVCLVYDSSDPSSFSYIASLWESHAILQSRPVVVVATKSDLDRASQRYEMQPDEFCQSQNIGHSLLSVSVKDDQLANLFETLVQSCMDSGQSGSDLSMSSRRRLQAATTGILSRFHQDPIMTAAIGGGVLAVSTIALFALYRILSRKQ